MLIYYANANANRDANSNDNYHSSITGFGFDPNALLGTLGILGKNSMSL